MSNNYPYGREAIFDLKDCDTKAFNESSLAEFFSATCLVLDLIQCEIYSWNAIEYATCFNSEGSITVRMAVDRKGVYVNVFLCYDFDIYDVRKLVLNHFSGTVVRETLISRGVR